MVLALTIVACASTESQNIRTGGLWPSFDVVGTEEGIDASVYLRVGGPTGTVVDLDAPDVLTCSDGTDAVEMTEASVLGSHYYVLNYPPADTAVPFEFALDRPEDTSAPSTSADFPTAPLIAAPAADAVHPLGEALTVTWAADASHYDVRVKVFADCIPDGLPAVVTDDPGTWTFSDYVYEDRGAPCEATVQVERHGDGVLDPAFSGGDIHTEQRRTVVFTLE